MIKFFNASKGFGFIVQDDGSDLFFHRNDVWSGSPGDGDEVIYDIAANPRSGRPIAMNVCLVGGGSGTPGFGKYGGKGKGGSTGKVGGKGKVGRGFGCSFDRSFDDGRFGGGAGHSHAGMAPGKGAGNSDRVTDYLGCDGRNSKIQAVSANDVSGGSSPLELGEGSGEGEDEGNPGAGGGFDGNVGGDAGCGGSGGVGLSDAETNKDGENDADEIAIRVVSLTGAEMNVMLGRTSGHLHQLTKKVEAEWPLPRKAVEERQTQVSTSRMIRYKFIKGDTALNHSSSLEDGDTITAVVQEEKAPISRWPPSNPTSSSFASSIKALSLVPMRANPRRADALNMAPLAKKE